MVQQVTDLVLSLLWHRFDPWLGNCSMLQTRPPPQKKGKVAKVMSPIYFYHDFLKLIV